MTTYCISKSVSHLLFLWHNVHCLQTAQTLDDIKAIWILFQIITVRLLSGRNIIFYDTFMIYMPFKQLLAIKKYKSSQIAELENRNKKL